MVLKFHNKVIGKCMYAVPFANANGLQSRYVQKNQGFGFFMHAGPGAPCGFCNLIEDFKNIISNT